MIKIFPNEFGELPNYTINLSCLSRIRHKLIMWIAGKDFVCINAYIRVVPKIEGVGADVHDVAGFLLGSSTVDCNQMTIEITQKE